MSKDLSKEQLVKFLGFVTVAGILYVFWLTGSFFVSILAAADPRISATILGAMITAIIGLAASIITQIQTKSREIEEAHREKKVEIYQKFLGTITSFLSGQNEKLIIKAPTEQELADFLLVHICHSIFQEIRSNLKAHIPHFNFLTTKTRRFSDVASCILSIAAT
jgi:hypothetical protein